MSIPAGIDPSDFLDLHYCEECRKIGVFENDLCGECAALCVAEDDPMSEDASLDFHECDGCRKIGKFINDVCGDCAKNEVLMVPTEDYICAHCGQLRPGYQDEGGICSQCIKRDRGIDGGSLNEEA